MRPQVAAHCVCVWGGGGRHQSRGSRRACGSRYPLDCKPGDGTAPSRLSQRRRGAWGGGDARSARGKNRLVVAWGFAVNVGMPTRARRGAPQEGAAVPGAPRRRCSLGGCCLRAWPHALANEYSGRSGCGGRVGWNAPGEGRGDDAPRRCLRGRGGAAASAALQPPAAVPSGPGLRAEPRPYQVLQCSGQAAAWRRARVFVGPGHWGPSAPRRGLARARPCGGAPTQRRAGFRVPAYVAGATTGGMIQGPSSSLGKRAGRCPSRPCRRRGANPLARGGVRAGRGDAHRKRRAGACPPRRPPFVAACGGTCQAPALEAAGERRARRAAAALRRASSARMQQVQVLGAAA